MAATIFTSSGKHAGNYNWRQDFAYFVNGDKTTGFQCPACCASESMDLYVWQRKRNVNGDRLLWSSRPEEDLQERVLFMRDPMDRLEGAYRYHRFLEESPAVDQKNTLVGRLRDKPNLANDREFLDIIFSTVAGYPEVIHESWLPLSELYKHRITQEYVPTQHKRIEDVEAVLPGFPNVTRQRPQGSYSLDRNYRKAEVEAYYSDDIATWQAIQPVE